MLTFFNEHHAEQRGRPGMPGDGGACADQPERIDIVAAEFAKRGLGRIVTPHSVPPSSLERVHTPSYLHFLRGAWSEWLALDAHNAGREALPLAWPARGMRHDREPDDFHGRLGLHSQDAFTPIGAGTWIAAKTGADCAINAAHAVRLGQPCSFALTRPPGHHAGAAYSGGACYLNNAALAAQHLLDDGLERVAILDIDHQHGNGTQSIFYQRKDVLFLSIHADPRDSYPWYLGHADETGEGDGLGYTMNLPLARGADAARWFAALETACLKLAAYAPQALVVSFGGGPQADAFLASPDYLRIGERIGYLELPTVFVLEGGAAVPELGINVVNVLEGFETGA